MFQPRIKHGWNTDSANRKIYLIRVPSVFDLWRNWPAYFFFAAFLADFFAAFFGAAAAFWTIPKTYTAGFRWKEVSVASFG